MRPQTLYGFADSPVALAARMLDHDARSYEDIGRAVNGEPVGNLGRDEIPDNTTLWWLTKASRLNWEYKGGHFAAWEEPELFSAEVRAGFRSLPTTTGGRHE